ncbi:MAG: hypothetical protein JSR54_02450 [Proteobacteria bacterium]|nr:hypothetical protein [Pseudomonadota bacterium]
MRRTIGRAACAAGLLALPALAALATPPTPSALGAAFRVVDSGASPTIEIRLRPSVAYDRVTVEPGSGVASLAPPCVFEPVAAGQTYTCRVTVAHTAGQASLTLNVVGQRPPVAGARRAADISHYTLRDPGFAAPPVTRAGRPPQGLVATPPRS